MRVPHYTFSSHHDSRCDDWEVLKIKQKMKLKTKELEEENWRLDNCPWQYIGQSPSLVHRYMIQYTCTYIKLWATQGNQLRVNDPVDQEYKMEKEINIGTRMLSIKPDTVKESSTKSL